MRTNIRRIIVYVLALATVLGLCSPALATPPATIAELATLSQSALFEGKASGNVYSDIVLSIYANDATNDKNTAVCYGLDYTATVATTGAAYAPEGSIEDGLKLIMQYGYPLNTPDSCEIKSHFPTITVAQMQYATAAAVCAWTARSSSAADSVFKTFMTEGAATSTAIRAKVGNEIAFSYFKDLLNKAANPTANPYAAQISPASGSVTTENSTIVKNLYLEQDGYYKGDLPIIVNKCSEPYTWEVVPTETSVTQGEFDTNNQVNHALKLSKDNLPTDTSTMHIKFSADDYATLAEINTYADATTTTNGKFVRAKRGEVTTVNADVKLKAIAVTNEAFNIVKTDAADDTPVKGATISIYTSTDTFIKSGETDAQGKLAVTGLSPGAYYFKETAAPANYELNTDKYNFTVLEDGKLQEGSKTTLKNVKKNVTNTPFDIVKTNSVTGGAVENSYIAIYDSTGVKKMQSHTNAEGKMNVTGLVPGTYTFKEEQAPSGYQLNTNTFTFTVSSTGEVTGTKALTNTPTTSPTTDGINQAFYIQKTDASTGATLSGALFSIYDSKSNAIKSGETGTNGRLLIAAKTLPQGTYTIYEDIAPAGYQRSNTGTTITVLSTGEVRGVTNGVVTITNTLAPNTTTTPTGNTGNCVTVYQTGTSTPVQGVVLTFTNSSNTSSTYTATTDANGKAYFASFPNATYNYKATQVPATYACSSDQYTMTKTGQNTATGTLTAYVDFICVSFKKVDAKDTSKALSGAKFTLYDASYNEVSSVTTGTDGMAKFIKLNPGKYSVKEVTAPKGYTPSNDVWSFEVTNTSLNGAATLVKNSGGVQTGVTSIYPLLLGISALIAIGIAGYIFYTQKKKQKKAKDGQDVIEPEVQK